MTAPPRVASIVERNATEARALRPALVETELHRLGLFEEQERELQAEADRREWTGTADPEED